MDIRLKVDVDISTAMSQLNGMSARSANFKPVFRVARGELEQANRENFATGGLPVGGWAPQDVNDGTNVRGYGWPILRRTGRLFSSLTNLRGAPNDMGRNSAVFGTNVEYAKFHQQGTDDMPRRLVVFEPSMFAERLGFIAAEYVADGMLPD